MQAYAYIPQAHNQWQLRGKHKFIWGGRDVECTPTQPSSPITRPAASRSTCAQHALSPFPLSMSDMRSGARLRHAVCAVNTVPFIYVGEREVQHPQSFRILGIVHALYI